MEIVRKVKLRDNDGLARVMMLGLNGLLSEPMSDSILHGGLRFLCIRFSSIFRRHGCV